MPRARPRTLAMLTTGDALSQWLKPGQFWIRFCAPGTSGTLPMLASSRCAMKKSGLALSRPKTLTLWPGSSTYSCRRWRPAKTTGSNRFRGGLLITTRR